MTGPLIYVDVGVCLVVFGMASRAPIDETVNGWQDDDLNAEYEMPVMESKLPTLRYAMTAGRAGRIIMSLCPVRFPASLWYPFQACPPRVLPAIF